MRDGICKNKFHTVNAIFIYDFICGIPRKHKTIEFLGNQGFDVLLTFKSLSMLQTGKLSLSCFLCLFFLVCLVVFFPLWR